MLQALKLRTGTSDAAFEKLWEAQRPRIQRLATRLCGNPELAEDLTQEIGLQALTAFPGFRRQCAPTTFLYRIAVRFLHVFKYRGGHCHCRSTDLPYCVERKSLYECWR
jgi:DNA-directed RNA polymerase specialized sigma24 family protein